MIDNHVFTDADLDPRRTTRHEHDPLVDGVDSLIRGDHVLVSTEAYDGNPAGTWCRFKYSSLGSASTYPYKVEIPDRGEGQYAAREILAWVRPVELHRMLQEVIAETPAGEGLEPGRLAAARNAGRARVAATAADWGIRKGAAT